MERICRRQTGLFPAPREIRFSCSCPDWASMCKHVAAVLYGIGARLDEHPELLFQLREVQEQDLITRAGSAMPLTGRDPPAGKVLRGQGLSELFGLEMAVASGERRSVPRPERRMTTTKRTTTTTKKKKKKKKTTTTTTKRATTKKRATTTRQKTPHGSAKGARGVQRTRRTSAAGKATLEAMIAEAIVDAYGESEQRAGLFTMIEDSLALPFETEVLGVSVTVERVDLTAAEEIVAVCRRGSKRQRIPILELSLPAPPPAGAEWIEAYRRWARGI